MPIRDELIERAVRQLAAAFARLLAGRHGVPVTEAEVAEMRSELDDIYRRFIGTSAALVGRLSTDDLLRVLGSTGYVDGERAYLLSALLETEAELEAASGTGADDGPGAGLPRVLRARALDLALEAGIEELGEPDLTERVERLSAQVPAPDRQPATWERLVWFWRAQRRWSRSEDALFDWLEEVEGGAGGDELLGRTAERLYGHLEQLDDLALEKGELPRDELAEGRAEFAARLAEVEAAS